MPVNFQGNIIPQAHDRNDHDPAQDEPQSGAAGNPGTSSATPDHGSVDTDAGNTGGGDGEPSQHSPGATLGANGDDAPAPTATMRGNPMLRFGATEFMAQGGVIAVPSFTRAAGANNFVERNTLEEFSDPIETLPPPEPSPTPVDPSPPPPPPVDVVPIEPPPPPPPPPPVEVVPVEPPPNPTPNPAPTPINTPGLAGAVPPGTGAGTPTPPPPPPPPPPTTNPPPTQIHTPGLAGATPPSTTVTGIPSRREPHLFPGLHTAPEQSPHYAAALAYGRDHDYSDDEVMKLAVLMQSNRGQSNGREWMDLKPEVLRACVNAVARNPDNSFDISGVFGGTRGYYDAGLVAQRINIDAEGYALDHEGSRVGNAPCVPPQGWVLDTQDLSSGDSGPNTIRFYRPSDEMLAANDIPYLPMMLSGYVQVPHGADSYLSVGADGGVHDLSRLDFHPEYGLVTTPDNLRPIDNEDGLDEVFVIAVLTVATYGAFSAAGAVGVSGAALTTAQALAISSGIATTVATGDLRQGFIAGLASLAGAQVAQWIVGPSGLALNVNPNNPWTVGNFVSSIISGTVSGAIQGDWRRGLVNGLFSFASNVIAHELPIPRTVASAAIRALYDPQGALNGLVTDLITNPGSVIGGLVGTQGTDLAARREAAIQELMAQGMNPEHAALAVDRMIAEATRLNTVTAQARAEVQQRITWIRDAIDQGYGEEAANQFNTLVDRAMAENPGQSRADLSTRLMRALGIDPQASGFTVTPDGRVSFDRLRIGGGDSDNTAAYENSVQQAMAQLRAKEPWLSETELRERAEAGLRIDASTSRLRDLLPNQSDSQIREQAIGIEADRRRIQEYVDRQAALPDDQKPYVIAELVLNEGLGARFAALAGTPMTREQQLRAFDVVLGIAPVTGEAVSVYEFIYGRSPASGEEASRVFAAVGILTGGYGRTALHLLSPAQRAVRDAHYIKPDGSWIRNPTGQQAASAELRSALGAPPSGMANPEAHHVLGFGIGDFETQKLFNRLGITPNSIDNGLYLPYDVHKLTFGNEYRTWIAQRFEGVASREVAIQRLNDIKDYLRTLKPGDVPIWRQGK